MWISLTPEQVERARIALAIGEPEIADQIKHYQDLEADPRTPKFRDASVEDGEDGTLEFDDDAVVSFSDDGGAYVMSWSWVSNADAGLTAKGEAPNEENVATELVEDWLEEGQGLESDPAFRAFVRDRWQTMPVEKIAEQWEARDEVA